MSNDNSESLITTAEAIRVLKQLVMHFPADSDLFAAGWESSAVDEACDAYESAVALLAKATTA